MASGEVCKLHVLWESCLVSLFQTRGHSYYYFKNQTNSLPQKTCIHSANILFYYFTLYFLFLISERDGEPA